MVNPTIAAAILMGLFFALIILHLPITFSLCIATGACMIYCKIPLMTLIQNYSASINSFTLMAIPFFVLAGEIMGSGGISDRLLKTADACVGHIRGGLAHVNVLASMLFGSMSGSAVADVSSLGSIEVPMMVDGGYDREFSVAITVASSCQGVLIPPSHNMVMYSLAAGGCSIGALFMGGAVPGITLGILFMIVCYFLAVKRNYPYGERKSWKERLEVIGKAIPALMTVIIILGGVLSGIFTATESAAIACVWAFVVSVFFYKELKIREMPRILLTCTKNLAMIYALIGSAGAFGFMMSYLRVPAMLTNALLGISDNYYVILIIINIMLLVLGCFMDMVPLILLCTPILLPVVQSFGMSTTHFGVMMVYNLCVGLCTPPVGNALFVGCSVGKTTIEKVTKALLPLYATMVVGLVLVTFFPPIVEFLPKMMGYAV